MSAMRLRTMNERDCSEVAELICVSTNYWYQARGGPVIFPAGPEATDIYFQVYEAMDPGCGVVAENPGNGRLMGSCFFHPRPRHVSLGIMNVHPNYFGRGVARALLQFIIDYADQNDCRSLRLTQSAMNLDSFSLYTRAGFVPRCAYQDLLIHVPASGLPQEAEGRMRVRPATEADVPAMTALEMEVSGITREKDCRHTIANREGIWEVLVIEGPDGIDGWMISVKHAAMNMLGPCVARTQQQAASLIGQALDRFRGGCAVFLVPVDSAQLVRQMYSWGARNCELHFCQVRGDFQPFQGVNMPTFLPETG
ncbi:MAG: GNAT family N-acetyltransferase [Rhodopirellula sp.]|nr:GNAT family N-acetyltransferase [Rhodopirellula sp.]